MRSSVPTAMFSGDARPATSTLRTPVRFSTVWAYEKPPASNSVLLVGPIERFSVFSIWNCILFLPKPIDASMSHSPSDQVTPPVAL